MGKNYELVFFKQKTEYEMREIVERSVVEVVRKWDGAARDAIKSQGGKKVRNPIWHPIPLTCFWQSAPNEKWRICTQRERANVLGAFPPVLGGHGVERKHGREGGTGSNPHCARNRAENR